MLAWSFLLPFTHGKPKCRHAEELQWQTCQMLLPFSCPILPFKAGKLKEHRSSSIQIIKISFTSKVKYNSHMPEVPALQIRWGHAQTTAYPESIRWMINSGRVLLFLKLWTFRNCNTSKKNHWSGNVTAEYCSLILLTLLFCFCAMHQKGYPDLGDSQHSLWPESPACLPFICPCPTLLPFKL